MKQTNNKTKLKHNRHVWLYDKTKNVIVVLVSEADRPHRLTEKLRTCEIQVWLPTSTYHSVPSSLNAPFKENTHFITVLLFYETFRHNFEYTLRKATMKHESKC